MSAESSKDAVAILARRFFQKGLRGRQVDVVALEIVSDVGLPASRIEGFSFLYLTQGLTESQVAAIIAVTRRQEVLTIAGLPDYVNQGVSLGVIERGDQSRVLINRAASIEEGAEFSSQLLRMSEVVGKEQ